MPSHRNTQRRLHAIRHHIAPVGVESTVKDLFAEHGSNHPVLPTAVVDDMFEKYFSTGRAPGVAYGVVLNGKLVHSGGLGKLRAEEAEGGSNTPAADTLFRIASMSKSFVAAAVLLLRDEGVLQLDDALEKWVPELKGLPLATEDSRPATIRQFLSMHAGYPGSQETIRHS